MKTFNKRFLPESITYNKNIYVRSMLLSNLHTLRQPFDKRGCVMVKVLANSLKGKTNLRGKQYQPTEWIFIKELKPRYPNGGLLEQYGSRLYSAADMGQTGLQTEWLMATYPDRYQDVREGDWFILWNGDGLPVPMVQLRAEPPDKFNRPTRLLDGCYVSLRKDMRVKITTQDIVTSLKQEISDIAAHN